jgi:hypothetical protein
MQLLLAFARISFNLLRKARRAWPVFAGFLLLERDPAKVAFDRTVSGRMTARPEVPLALYPFDC